MASRPEDDLTPFPRITAPSESGDDGPQVETTPGGSGRSPEPVSPASPPQAVLIEFQGGGGMSPVAVAAKARSLGDLGFTLDEEFEIVPMAETDTYVVRGTIAREDAIPTVEQRPDVVKVWRDTPIAHF
jgi:hypothetical protein